MSSIVCYTAIFGNIGDQLYPPERSGDTQYIAFVDDPTPRQAGWQLRPPQWIRPDKRRQARQHKCLAHELFPEADYTFWVDGCLTPLQPAQELVEYLLNDHDLATFEHMERNCVYQELEACLRLHKDVPELMRKQIAKYRREGYPHHNGLAETTAVLRRNTPKIREFNQLWWDEIRNESTRDQLSFDYVCWKLGITYAHLEGTRVSSPHFTWRAHR